MKKMILLFFLLASCFMRAADLKVAVVGDSPDAEKTADMVLTVLSERKDIAVLERGEIDKLLREYKLARTGMTAAELAGFAKIAHVDLFAVINSAVKNKKNVVSSLLIFDAKSGFKLRELGLSGELEKDVKTVSKAISTASTQLHMTPKIIYVAVLAVRNAGVPSRYNPKLENVAGEVRRRLVAAPDIAVLERSRLGLVLKERRLSKEIHKLLPSAYLLDFEFSQGSSAKIVNLKLYLMSPSGKILKEFSYPDCIKESSGIVNKIISDLGKYFNKPLSSSGVFPKNSIEK